jgi:hypothetical protein
MAHYIAELIDDAENANPADRPAKMHACSEAILNLWKHRHELPSGKRPFEELEPILRTLKSLDPDEDRPRYFRLARSAADEAKEDSEGRSWLQLIDGLDYSVRLLIRYCFTRATQTTLDKAAEWVALAEEARADDGSEFPTIRMVVGEKELLTKANLDEITRERLQDRIARLNNFIEMANTLASELRQRIQETPSNQKSAG